MNDNEKFASALEEIDTKIYQLFEDLIAAEDLDRGLQREAIEALQEARSAIDPALFALQHRDAAASPSTEAITLQWTPAGSPPRRLIIDPSLDTDGYSRRLLEWDGLGWRPHSREAVDEIAICAPAAARRRSPTDPPRLETLREQLRGTWAHTDPFTLVFDGTASTEPAIVADVDNDLRYREPGDTHWEALTAEDLQDVLQQRGQPTLTLLSETPLERAAFTGSPPEDCDSDPDEEVS